MNVGGLCVERILAIRDVRLATTAAAPTTSTTTTTTTTTIAGTPPTVSNGSFNPVEIDWTPVCEVEVCSRLEFYVCDPESDLLGAYVKHVDVPFFLFRTTMDRDELVAPGDLLTDCDSRSDRCVFR
ncbi:MAG: hypothetical protein IT350_00730 [Deltaproteobacteria bacterium]|nr:hypothetical protein [Deltaproteobacteria bacterium]